MRLKRLDLSRYGRFTDYQLDLGEHKSGTPDLHIIYSPDEASKSALQAAWMDLLYGIAAQRPAMRVGATVQLANGVHELLRIKKPDNRLLDTDGRPMDLSRELTGMDREAYCTLFSLHEGMLEQGGDSILEAKGELGQLLFAASSGLADLGARIVALHGQADGFHRQGQSGELEKLRAELEQLTQQRAELDTQAVTYAELAEALRAAKGRHDEATAERNRLHARRDEIQRILGARPWLGRLHALREQLAPLSQLPDAPAGWQEGLPALREAEIRLDTQVAASQEEVERLEQTVAAISVDTVGCDLPAQLESTEALRTQYLTAERELPERRQRLAELDQVIAFQLRRMERQGEAQPERLVLPASTVERLRELMEQHSGVVTAVNKSAEELSEAQQQVQTLTQKLRSRAEAAPALENHQNLLEHVRAALEALRASDHTTRRRQAEGASHRAQEALRDAIAALLPWRGQPNELLGIAAPESAVLQRWKTAQETLHRQEDQQRAEIERLTGQCAQLSAQHESLSRVVDHQSAVIRVERDQAWARHRSQLDPQSAEAFEEQLRKDDAVAAQRLTDLAQLSATASALAVAHSDLMHAQGQLTKTLAEAEALAQEMRSALAVLYPQLPNNWTLPQLEGWLIRRERALEARAAVQAAARDIKQADDDAKALTRRLTIALEALQRPLPASPDETELAAAAQAVLDGEARIKNLQKELEERERAVQMCERIFVRTTNRRRQWEVAWQQVCGSCWLAEGGTVPAISTVRGVLSCLPKLSAAVNERMTLADRIDQMEEDRRMFEEAVVSLVDRAGIPRNDGAPIMELVRRIEDRARQAQAGRARQAQETARLTAAREAARALAAEKQAHARHKQEMLAHLGVSSLAEGAARLSQIATRDDLRQELAIVEQQILTSLRHTTVQEAEAALAAVDQATLEREIAGISAQWEPLERECRDSYAAYREAQRPIEAIGGDDAVARVEEQRRTVLLAINDGVRRHLRLRAGLVATEAALRLYREQHRSSMLGGASKTLRVVSRGAYTHLTTRVDGASEVLVAVAADYSSKPVTELPKAARTQLYLALRVAGYLELAKPRPPVPFIADDIVGASDDLRAEEALPLMTAMAAVGQVIYLTRHRQLCEVARKVCPTAQIHQLPELEGSAEAAEAAGASGLAEVP